MELYSFHENTAQEPCSVVQSSRAWRHGHQHARANPTHAVANKGPANRKRTSYALDSHYDHAKRAEGGVRTAHGGVPNSPNTTTSRVLKGAHETKATWRVERACTKRALRHNWHAGNRGAKPAADSSAGGSTHVDTSLTLHHSKPRRQVRAYPSSQRRNSICKSQLPLSSQWKPCRALMPCTPESYPAHVQTVQ